MTALLRLGAVSGSVLAPCATLAEQELPPKEYRTPQAAAEDLAKAARLGDQQRLLEIFGSKGKSAFLSGDPVADRKYRQAFATAYDQAHELVWARDAGDVYILTVGADNWPFPVAIVKEDGVWRFDSQGGVEQLNRRRIARNERAAEQVARAYVNAQRDYAERDQQEPREYARKLLSSPGKRDGLYWPTVPGEEQSPMGPTIAQAMEQGYRRSPNQLRTPYFGYEFKILEAQGSHAPGGVRSYLVDGRLTKGFALVAFPTNYGVSGQKTFIVGPEGIVYAQDLGPETKVIAEQMTRYDPGPGWAPIPQQVQPRG